MESILFGLSFICYLTATVFHIIHISFKKKIFRVSAVGFTGVGFGMQTAALILRTIVSGHAPFSNMYESLVFFSWTIILIYFFI